MLPVASPKMLAVESESQLPMKEASAEIDSEIKANTVDALRIQFEAHQMLRGTEVVTGRKVLSETARAAIATFDCLIKLSSFSCSALI